ncbi:Pre-rRNA-processing protein TSR2 [Escovopsis weberi]|uniref:Pre-rRNA-processing protein TSR2 n=1 Tax=Escovopsis weberi TaxID=150374 RepID=A0A0M8MUX0_ESCWE|nr:Pre-rRNA-processing protein TSR2 [Escovopsis weberi]
MASTEGAQQPQATLRQSEFEQAVAYSLHLWPSLTLAVQNNWGGPDSADKRDWFAGAIVDLFPEFPAGASDPSQSKSKSGNSGKSKQDDDAAADDDGPDVHDVEEVLLQVMLDEFEVNVDDDSSFEVAENIVRAREQLAAGKFDEVNRLRGRFNALRGKKVDQLFKKAEDQDQDTDWESDDGEDEDEDGDDGSDGAGDVHMDDAPALVAAPREKPAPEVDEDGFTKVTRKKR